MYILQVKSNLGSICFNLGQFNFCCCWFCSEQKKYFWHLQSTFHPTSSLHLHSTYLTYYSLPSLPTSQPLFFLSQCLYLVGLEPQDFGFPLDSCPDALQVSHGDLDASSTIFLITYTL